MSLVVLLAGFVVFAQQPPVDREFKSLLDRGVEAYSHDNYAEAEGFLKRAVARQPRRFDARFLLGATLVQMGRSEEGIEQLREAVRLNPTHADARKLLAAQHMLRRDFTAATAVLLKAPALDEEMHLLLMEAYQDAGDTAKAFALAQKAAARFPRSPQVNCWMGFQLQFSGRYADAKTYLQKALKLQPDYAPTYYLLADVLLKEQNYKAAIPNFRTAIEKNPDDLDARLGLAQALMGLEDYANALTALEEAAKMSPQESKVHLQLSKLFYRMGDEARSDQEAQLSVRLRSREAPPTETPAALKSAPLR